MLMTIAEQGALRIVNRHALYSAAAGLVPLPVFDLAAITGVQVKMLKDLADHYHVPYGEDMGKGLISALIGGIVPTRLAWGAAGSFIKGLPVIGSVLGMITSPAFASASTYAVGKVFIQHFESGGTFLDFDPNAVRAHFAREFDAAKQAGVGSTPMTSASEPASSSVVISAS
jgi:uncharacterized protein (DUF697 family)